MEVFHGDITSIPLPDSAVDRILCMSVLQYVDDSQLRVAFREFARILKKDGTLVLHVKNLASLYLSTLWLMKRLCRMGKDTQLEIFERSIGTLANCGVPVLASQLTSH